MSRIALLFAASLVAGTASAQPLCGPGQARYGTVPASMCAPVDGGIARRSADGKCAGGKFGDARSAGRSHEGLDLLSPIGSPVYAAAAGKVVMVAYFRNTSGYQVNVVHENGDVTRYFHLKDAATTPAPAALVVAGDRIGYSDISGNAKDTACPHLHLEVRAAAFAPDDRNANWTYGGTKDPLTWLTTSRSTGDVDATASPNSIASGAGVRTPK